MIHTQTKTQAQTHPKIPIWPALLGAFLFLISVLVQYNDPDPLRWMLMYGAAMIACIWRAVAVHFGNKNGYTHRATLLFAIYTSTVASAAIVWAVDWMPSLQPVSLVHIFTDAGMYHAGVEEAREFGGLLIIAVWMGLYAWKAVRKTA